MRLARHAALALALLSPAAAVAQAPAAAPPVRVPGLSPAGNAALTKLNTKVDPAVAAHIRETNAFRQQMVALLNAPTVDLDKLAAALRQGRALTAREREIADDHLLTMLRVLSPADRIVMLRVVATARPGPAPAK